MKKIAPIFILVVTIAIIGYFESPKFTVKEEAVTSFPVPIEESEEATASNNDELEEAGILPAFETRLVEIREEDGEIVEVYREYEIYKDDKGEIVKTVPTSNYEYLRYKQ